MAHHGGIDEKHHHRGDLREHRGNAQLHDKLELLAACQLGAITDLRQEGIAFLTAEHRCKGTHKTTIGKGQTRFFRVTPRRIIAKHPPRGKVCCNASAHGKDKKKSGLRIGNRPSLYNN